MAIGAYAGAILTANNPTFGGFLSGLIVGMFVSGADRTSCRDSTLRLKGDYLA